MRRVECEVDVLEGRARYLRERLAGRWREVLGVLALHRCDPVAADEVVVSRLQLDGTVDMSRRREGRDLLDGCHDMLLPSGIPSRDCGFLARIAPCVAGRIRESADLDH